jgi:hypothetical protein
MTAAEFSRKYVIVGTGIVTGPFDPATTARAAETEAARLAIEDAGLRRDQVDGAVQARRAGGAGDRASFTDAFPRILGLPFTRLSRNCGARRANARCAIAKWQSPLVTAASYCRPACARFTPPWCLGDRSAL